MYSMGGALPLHAIFRVPSKHSVGRLLQHSVQHEKVLGNGLILRGERSEHSCKHGGVQCRLSAKSRTLERSPSVLARVQAEQTRLILAKRL
jgi:hypothetical protein